MADWFDQNAPAPAAQDDWFAQNTPAATPAATYQGGQATGFRKADTGVGAWLNNLEGDIKGGGTTTLPGKILHAMGAQGTNVGAQAGAGDTLVSPVMGPIHAAQGVAETPQHPVRGPLKAIGGALETASLPAAFMAPEAPEIKGGVQKASEAFNRVAEVAGKAPIDITGPGNQAMVIDQLAQRGGTVPKVVRDFIKRVTDPEKGPLTYDEARDFYSNASRLSADEYNRLTPRLKKEIGQFTEKLGESVQEAATRVGKGEDYNYAMKQYRNAMKLREFGEKLTDLAKNAVGKAAAGAGLGAGYQALKKLTE